MKITRKCDTPVLIIIGGWNVNILLNPKWLSKYLFPEQKNLAGDKPAQWRIDLSHSEKKHTCCHQECRKRYEKPCIPRFRTVLPRLSGRYFVSRFERRPLSARLGREAVCGSAPVSMSKDRRISSLVRVAAL